jgi:hypothetical protein
MCWLEARCYTGTRVTACIHDVLAIMILGLIEECFNARLSERPAASVQGLFLTPNNGLSVGVHVKVFLKLLPGEGVQLLDASDGCVGDLVVGPVFMEGDVDLTGAEDDALDLLRIVDGVAVFWVWDDPLELCVTGKLIDG